LDQQNPKAALYTRHALASGAWLFVQQLVVASSTIFIILVMENLKEPTIETALIYLVLFVISLTIVYIPTAASEIQLERARFASRKYYLQMFVNINKRRRTFARKHYKREHQSWIANESGAVYQEATELIYQAFATFLNATLNIIVIAVVIDYRFIVWYAGAAVLLYVVSLLSRNILIRTSLKLQTTRKSLTDHLLRAWDNVLIGNNHNISLWARLHTKCLKDAESAAVKNTMTRLVISSLTAVGAMLIIAIGVYIYIIENISNYTALAIVIITFPRQILVLQSIFYFFGHIIEWHGVAARLESLNNPLKLHHQKNPTDFICLDQIDIVINNGTLDITSVDDFITKVSKLKSGRITLRGDNGSGKSTLLAYLCESLGKQAFFLPASNLSLIFHDTAIGLGSDGQNAAAVINELLTISLPKVVALDEWDANLDNSNIQYFYKELNTLSEQHVVIEVRHN